MLQWGPAIVLGLLLGRVISEQWATFSGSTLLRPLLVTLFTIFLSVWLLRTRPLSHTWSLFFLLVYVLYPQPDPEILFIAVALVLLVTLQNAGNRLQAVPTRWQLAIFCGLSGLAFWILYVATMATDILPADNGEFQLIATNLGVAHPPGFPLYTMMAHAITKLPLPVSPAYKINLLSTLTSALTLVIVYLSVYRLTKHPLASVTAVVALGTATTFWAQATVANIRSLTGLFAALAIYALLRFWQAKRAPQSGDASRYLVLFALSLGFGVTHHASLAFMGIIFIVFVLVVDPTLIKRPRHWLRPLLAASLALLPLLYIPWRASTGAERAPARLATFQGFLNHILARGFQGDFFYFIEPAVLWERLQVMGNIMTFQFHPLLLLGMGLGLLLLLKDNRYLALLLGGSFTIHTFITATYRAPQTVEYMLPAYIPAVIILGCAIGKIPSLLKQPGIVAQALPQGVTAVFLVITFYQGWQHYPSYAYLHQDHTARDYAQGILEQAPAGGVILAHWHWVTSLWYLQEVEGQRPDVDIHYVAPTGETYTATWARRIQEEMANERPIIATHFNENTYASLPPSDPLGEAFLFRQEPLAAVPAEYRTLDLNLGNTVQLLGYRLHPATVEVGQEATLTLAWRPISKRQTAMTLFAHLIGFDGAIYAQEDLAVQGQDKGLTLTQFRLTPRLGAAPGDFNVMVGARDTAPLPNRRGEGRTAIATLTVTEMGHPPATQNPTYLTVANGRFSRRLIGYDWDNTLPEQSRLYLHWQTNGGYQTEVRDNITADSLTLPLFLGPWGIEINGKRYVAKNHSSTHYVPFGQGIVWTGHTLRPHPSLVPEQTISLPQVFVSGQPVTRDLVISVRLVGYEADGFHWAWCDLHDTVPAMGAIPTLKWIAGTRVRSPYRLVYAGEENPPVFEAFCQSKKPVKGLPVLFVAPAATEGQTGEAMLRIYDAFTNRPLPILDQRITEKAPWVSLGQTTIDPP